jgi:hypothetical protein
LIAIEPAIECVAPEPGFVSDGGPVAFGVCISIGQQSATGMLSKAFRLYLEGIGQQLPHGVG